MLERVLEPEVMDSAREAIDYDRMDHSEVNRVFVADLLALLPDVSEVLDLGTGTAQIPVELCTQAPAARVLAVDLAVHMLDVARANIEVAGLRDCIALDRVDGKQLPYDDNRFSTVISNSIVHHIPEPFAALREAWRVLQPDGVIFFRDLLRPATDADVQHLVATYAGDANEHQRQMFDDSLRAALSLDEIRGLVRQLGCDPATVQQTTDRHWTWATRKMP